MSIRSFVSGSAIALMAWLMVSFLHQSLPQRYRPDPRTADSEKSADQTSQAAESPLVSTISSSR